MLSLRRNVVLACCVLALASRAQSMVLCAHLNQKTGLVSEGATPKLRSACKSSEIPVDPGTLSAVATDQQAAISTVQGQLQDVSTRLAAVTLENNGHTVRFTGVNVQIVSGSGATDGLVNGTGNLIIGYDESFPNIIPDTKSGSHNLVVGQGHTYASYGGLIAGFNNYVTGHNATVSGGQANLATGDYSSVCGGHANIASATDSSVSGGNSNEAGDFGASVSGGFCNFAGSGSPTLLIGPCQTSIGLQSISGGLNNRATATHSTVSGGSAVAQSATAGWSAGSAGTAISGKFSSP